MVPHERRSEPRTRRIERATIVFPEGGAIDCFVGDWSAGGARLLVRNTVNVGGRFSLRCEALDIQRQARVVWRRPDELGVVYEERMRP